VLKAEISQLNAKKSSISGSLSSEFLKLNNLKDQIASENSRLDNRTSGMENREKSFSETQKQFEEKKAILKQIKELSDKL